MMGQQQDQPKLFYYGEAVNLQKRVRRENPLRAVKAGVDFSFVRPLVARHYGQNGNELRRGVAAAPPLVDPEVILKMMFLLFYDDIASERELMQIIAERLDYQWFLGYGLDDPVPDHSVLSKARRRWGPRVFERLFVRTVQQAVARGLVEGRKIHMDSSLVDADASKDSVRKGSPKLIAVLKRLYQKQEEKLDERAEILAAEAPTGEPGGAGGAPQRATESAAETDEGQPEKGRRYERVNEGLMSTTDPDAPVVRKGRGEARPRYKSHRAVDDAHGVITAVKSTPGDVDEGREWVGLLEQHERHTQKKVGAVVGDSKYGTTENFLACAHRGVRSHMADLSATQKDTGRRKDIYAESDFAYDPKTDTYRCAAGQTLKRRRHKIQRQAYEYTAGPKLCQACPKRAQCTRSPSGRSIKRHEDHEALQAARAESKGREARRDRRRRRFLMEGSFADAANNHHFKRARWRGLAQQQIQDLLIAAIQNVRILLQHTRRSTQGTQAGIKVALGSLSSFVLSLYGLLTCRAWRFRPRRACFGHLGP